MPFRCQHGKQRNISHAVSWLNPYIVPDTASIKNNSRFICSNNRLTSPVYFNKMWANLRQRAAQWLHPGLLNSIDQYYQMECFPGSLVHSWGRSSYSLSWHPWRNVAGRPATDPSWKPTCITYKQQWTFIFRPVYKRLVVHLGSN